MASNVLPVIYLVRHGETAWSRNDRHTGRTDLPLSERDERNADRLQNDWLDWLSPKSLRIHCSAPGEHAK